MRFETIIPCDRLKPYVRQFVISESSQAHTYKVFPSTGLVLGFQYRGQLSLVEGAYENKLAPSGISGITDSYRVFRNAAGTGTILVYFAETGLGQFTSCPAHELFNQSISVDNLFNRQQVADLEALLFLADNDYSRIALVEHFLLSNLKHNTPDKLVEEAVRLIHLSDGNIRIRSLQEQLYISSSAFEKRFRRITGSSPKKFASIVRFNVVLQQLDQQTSLSDICYNNNFFDQAHFIKDFKQYTGDTPENFKRFM